MIKRKNDNLKKYLTPFVFFLIILIFHLVFTRLLIKTDDGHFSGIVNAPDFTYSGWLTERYNTVSGRTIGEFLLVFFLRNNLIFWKLANSLMMTYPVYFWCKLSETFKGGFTSDEKQVYTVSPDSILGSPVRVWRRGSRKSALIPTSPPSRPWAPSMRKT